jgi:hypothetical protein
MSIHAIYLVSDLEFSDNDDPLTTPRVVNGGNLSLAVKHCLVTV